MKIKEIIKIIEATVGIIPDKLEARQFKHPDKKGTVTVAGKLSDDLDKGTQKSILKTGRREMIFISPAYL